MPSETVGYIISLILVLLVIRQIRGINLNLFNFVLPLVLVGIAAAYYLRSVPTAGNDVNLYIILIIVGIALGLGNGLFTKVYRDSPTKIIAKSGFIAAILWIAGMAARSVFVYEVEHGGAQNIAHFSEQHLITGAAAWTAALVFMAFAEILVRLGVLQTKGQNIRRSTGDIQNKTSEDSRGRDSTLTI